MFVLVAVTVSVLLTRNMDIPMCGSTSQATLWQLDIAQAKKRLNIDLFELLLSERPDFSNISCNSVIG